jgi:hypothetical protein
MDIPACGELTAQSSDERFAVFHDIVAMHLRLYGYYCFEWCELEDHRQAQADAHVEFAQRLLPELESAGWATHYWTDPSLDDPSEEPVLPGEQRQLHLYVGSAARVDILTELNREAEFLRRPGDSAGGYDMP